NQQRLGIPAGSLGKNFLDGLNRDAAGFLSTFVAAHAVGHDRQSALAREFLVVGGLPVSVLIFVVFSLAANVAHACQFNSRTYSHHTSRAAFEQLKTRSAVT